MQKGQHWTICCLFFIGCFYLSQQSLNDCDFLQQNAVCPLMVENVIDIETEDSMHFNSVEGCQYQCFLDKSCHNFTYFANQAGKRCILFRHCHSTMPCNKCVSGPRMPPIMPCKMEKQNEIKTTSEKSQNLEQRGDGPEITTFRPNIQLPRLPKQQQGFDIEGQDNSFDVEFIDDGLTGEDEKPRDVEPVTTTTRRPPTTTTQSTTTTEIPTLDYDIDPDYVDEDVNGSEEPEDEEIDILGKLF